MDRTYEVYGEWFVGDPNDGGFIDGLSIDCNSLEEVNERIREMTMIVQNGGYVWLQTPEVTLTSW